MCIIFIIHCNSPLAVFGSMGEACWFNGYGIRSLGRESMREWMRACLRVEWFCFWTEMDDEVETLEIL